MFSTAGRLVNSNCSPQKHISHFCLLDVRAYRALSRSSSQKYLQRRNTELKYSGILQKVVEGTIAETNYSIHNITIYTQHTVHIHTSSCWRLLWLPGWIFWVSSLSSVCCQCWGWRPYAGSPPTGPSRRPFDNWSNAFQLGTSPVNRKRYYYTTVQKKKQKPTCIFLMYCTVCKVP